VPHFTPDEYLPCVLACVVAYVLSCFSLTYLSTCSPTHRHGRGQGLRGQHAVRRGKHPQDDPGRLRRTQRGARRQVPAPRRDLHQGRPRGRAAVRAAGHVRPHRQVPRQVRARPARAPECCARLTRRLCGGGVSRGARLGHSPPAQRTRASREDTVPRKLEVSNQPISF
jgi:hypothetical protein